MFLGDSVTPLPNPAKPSQGQQDVGVLLTTLCSTELRMRGKKRIKKSLDHLIG